jgi:hypothetical protein
MEEEEEEEEEGLFQSKIFGRAASSPLGGGGMGRTLSAQRTWAFRALPLSPPHSRRSFLKKDRIQ